MIASLLSVAWDEHGSEVMRVAGVLGALAVIGRLAVVPVYRFFKNLESVVVVVKETLMTNNGGSTIKDQNDRTEEKVDLVIEQLGINIPDRLQNPKNKHH